MSQAGTSWCLILLFSDSQFGPRSKLKINEDENGEES